MHRPGPPRAPRIRKEQTHLRGGCSNYIKPCRSQRADVTRTPSRERGDSRHCVLQRFPYQTSSPGLAQMYFLRRTKPDMPRRKLIPKPALCIFIRAENKGKLPLRQLSRVALLGCRVEIANCFHPFPCGFLSSRSPCPPPGRRVAAAPNSALIQYYVKNPPKSGVKLYRRLLNDNYKGLYLVQNACEGNNTFVFYIR